MRSTYDRALDLLALRARSEAELRGRLLKKGAPPAEVEEVIARLREQRLVDDATFARQFARGKAVNGGASGRRIVQELRRRGVTGSIADEAVATLQVDEGIDMAATLHRVAAKKWAALARLDEPTRRRRLYAFLARRGFNPDEIRSAMLAVGEDVHG